jgi:signal recognition particle receptor subunit beta
MVFFNWATMQMAAKIVYYGPGLCGKTSNLSYIYTKTSPNSRGEMVSLETESDRTLFFDLLPIEVGTIGGFKTRLQLYTVPGQVFYNTTRKLVLKGVDGMVFVADSQRPMRDANIESFTSLKENLADLGLDFDDMPLVMQYNKRDLTGVLSVDELNADLNPEGKYTFFESSAINGDGVFDTLKAITKQTLKKIRKRMAAPQPQPAPAPSTTTSIRYDTVPPAPQPQPQPQPQPKPQQPQ